MMENPEEVLQALDEFQKMRPTEIPRELEDYLCWVAKTGDPVYQWSLVKALFREKLARVMTDFYETCPNVESLASCPNVEHFNYDSMKISLLERLESFANAPFTVQRICELLTSPRKEYNRIDKFMRAIEKNILVVSTREPGPIPRRSENNEALVNGSVDDELAQGTQGEMEMDTWTKECNPATSIALHSNCENDQAANSSQNTSVVKQLSSINGSTENPSKLSQNDVDTVPFSSNSEFVDSPETFSNVGHVVMHETSGVPEAIMNEDTSSQPSLDIENDEKETTPESRKLQTTFQAKDFIDSFKEHKDNDEIKDESSNVIVEYRAGESESRDVEKPEDLDKDMTKEAEENPKEEEETADCAKVEEENKNSETKILEECNKSENEDKDLENESENLENENSDEKILDDSNKNSENKVTIEETTEDYNQPNDLIPDPIPIVEEPKENEEKPWKSVSVIDVTRKVEVVVPGENEENEPPKKVMIIQEKEDEEEATKIAENQEEKPDKPEEMEVDSEAVSQDESMEQETSENVS